MTRANVALVVFVVATATIAGAWIFQTMGYAPCELCLKERIPYYVGAPLALAAWALATRGSAFTAVLGAVALIFACGAVLGGYHAGVEWGFWPGPSDCTGSYSAAGSTEDFLKQLNNVTVVRCDAVAVRVLGQSLAAWNAAISTVLAIVATWGATRRH
jgi:disulfide bond formation protein DsbB